MKQLLFLLAACFGAPLIQAHDYVWADFNTSMAQTSYYKASFPQEHECWKQAKMLYDEYILKHATDTTLRIPKIIHQIWLGSPFPQKYEAHRNTWLQNHPGWQYMLWTEKEVEQFGLSNKELYDTATNYGEKSDIVRYEILERFGGLYIDTDFECLHSFEPFHYLCDFYTGLNCGPTFQTFNGLIGSKAGHPILKECIRALKNPEKLKDRATQNILNRTGPQFFTECILRTLPVCNDNVVLFPTSYFYPWPHFFRKQNSRQQIEAWLRPETCAIHHWHVSWLK